MMLLADIIQTRLQQQLSPDQLTVLDESDKHIGHIGSQQGGKHFAIIIRAACFHDKSRIDAHREIYAVLKDLIPKPIHALRIEIV